MQSSDNPANGDVKLTIGSKNFTEQYILGEIYAQALSRGRLQRLDRPQPRLRAGRAEGARERQRRRLPRVHLDGADLVLQQSA